MSPLLQNHQKQNKKHTKNIIFDTPPSLNSVGSEISAFSATLLMPQHLSKIQSPTALADTPLLQIHETSAAELSVSSTPFPLNFRVSSIYTLVFCTL